MDQSMHFHNSVEVYYSVESQNSIGSRWPRWPCWPRDRCKEPRLIGHS